MTRGTKVTILFLVVILLVAIAATGYVLHRDNTPSAREQALLGKAGTTTSAFTDTSGESVMLEDALSTDQPLVVTTWASWCPTCGEQLQILQRVAETRAERVSFLAINRNETRAQARRYLATLPDFPNLTILLDPDDRYYQDIAGYAMPETIIYDAAGEVVEHLHGDSTTVELERALESL